MKYKMECNVALVQTFLEHSKSVEQARELSCWPVEAIGRPHGYTALLSTMVLAGPFVFSVYVNGRRETFDTQIRVHSDSGDTVKS